MISYIGYTSEYITVGNQDSITVSLQLDNELEEVVVTALGFAAVRDQQGSTSSVIATDDVVRSAEPTVVNALSGKASGVRITRSNGDPGAGSTIRIRGANTIDGSIQPLIIVDGVPMDNTTSYAGGNNITGSNGGVTQGSRLNDINPNDIESVQVLKGASAGALYGSKAANGVVVITTKKGSRGEAKITFKSSYSFDEISERIPGLSKHEILSLVEDFDAKEESHFASINLEESISNIWLHEILWIEIPLPIVM